MSLDRQYILDIDLNNFSETTTNISFMSGDTNTSEIIARFKKDKIVVDLTNFNVSINIKEGYYEVETFPCTISDPIKGEVTIRLPNKYVDENGRNLFSFTIQNEEKVLNSSTYSYAVVQNLGVGVPGTDIEKSYLQTIILQLQELDIINGEHTRVTQESIRVADEITRQEQEASRQQSMANMETWFNGLAPDESSNVEVQLARTDIKGVTHASLKARLDMMENNLNVIWETIEG